MKILIVCVNYNSYDVLLDYLASIDKSASNVLNKCKVVTCVADNTVSDIQNITYTPQFFDIKIFSHHKNYGYMGGAVEVLKELGFSYVGAFDYLIISNVDVILDVSFFEVMLSKDDPEVGWIVPSIYRIYNNMSNENPFLLNKPSLSRFKKYMFLYRHPFMCGLQTYISQYINSKKKNRQSGKVSPLPIYAGMGSIFIFTKRMIQVSYPFEFPCFMYGEELYYGYLVEKNKLKTVFYPDIKAYDICSVSTSKLGNSRKCQMNLDSLTVLQDIIY